MTDLFCVQIYSFQLHLYIYKFPIYLYNHQLISAGIKIWIFFISLKILVICCYGKLLGFSQLSFDFRTNDMIFMQWNMNVDFW